MLADSSSTETLQRFVFRMLRSARLDGAMFRSLRDDSSATRQAVVTLALAGLCFGLGFAVSLGADLSGVLLSGAVGIGAGILLGFVWLTLTYLVVTKLFKGASSYWGLGRPVFFATSPGLIFLLMMIPDTVVSEVFRVIGLVWITTSIIIAVKNSVGFDGQRSLVTFIIVSIILIIAYGLLTSI
jgi:hypothetical protein